MRKRKYDLILNKDFLESEYLVNKKSITDISKETNISETTIYNYLKYNNIPIRDGSLEPGERLSRLTTIKKSTIDKNGCFIWKCKCDCGNIVYVRTSDLVSGKQKSCGCLRLGSKKTKVYKGKDSPFWSGYKDISGVFLSNLKYRAQKTKRDINITKEYIWELFVKQNKKCYLSGIDISFENNTASIDRIDSNNGYIVNNIGISHKDINKIKNNTPKELFIYYCTLISNNKRIEHGCEYIDQVLCCEYYKRIIRGARERGIYNNITLEYIQDLFNKQFGRCSMSGIILNIPKTNKEYSRFKWTASLDRINNEAGYVEGNVQWVHKLINRSRHNLSIDYYKELCRKVKEWNSQNG